MSASSSSRWSSDSGERKADVDACDAEIQRLKSDRRLLLMATDTAEARLRVVREQIAAQLASLERLREDEC